MNCWRILLSVAAVVLLSMLMMTCSDPAGSNPEVASSALPDTLGAVVINEIGTNNSGGIYDEDGDDPDWIEVCNRGDTAINLRGYALSDDSADRMKWRFTDYTLVPHDQLLVFASGKNRPTLLGKTADDSVKSYDFKSWCDSQNDPIKGKSTVSTFEFRKMTEKDSSGRLQLSATLDRVDNRPELNWSTAFVWVLFKRWNFNTPNDYSKFRTLELIMTLDKGKKLTFQFTQNSFADWKGPTVPLIGTGVANDRYVIPLEQGKGGLDLTQLTGFKLVAPETDFGKVSFTVRRITFRNPDHFLHTNFKLSQNGETLLLSSPAGTIIDSKITASLPVNRSMGRIDGAWKICGRATPGLSNDTFSYEKYVQVSGGAVAGGFFNGPVTLELVDDNLVDVYYTLDGSMPGIAGVRAPRPLIIDATSVVRYSATLPGALSSQVHTATYFVNEPQRLPVVAITTEPSAFFDPDTGLYMLGPNAQDSFPFFGANFWSGKEIPVHCELFELNGVGGFSMDAGLGIAGNYSKGMDKKSLEIDFRSEYGSNELVYPLFPRNPGLRHFKKFILRNGGGTKTQVLFENSMMLSLIDDLDIDHQRTRPVVVYVNGTYFGIHYLMEPANQDYLYTNYDLKKESVDFYDRSGLMKWGTPDRWNQLIDQITAGVGVDVTDSLSDSLLTYIKQEVDVDNFIDYNAFEIYVNNTDWPANNVRYWREHGTKGKWRWLPYDFDAGFGGFGYVKGAETVDFNTLAFALDGSRPGDEWPNGSNSTFLLRALLQNTSCREDFINRFATLLSTNFAAEHVAHHIDSAAALIREEVPFDCERWKGKRSAWQGNVNLMRQFAQARTAKVFSFIRQQFTLGGTAALIIPESAGSVSINGMRLKTAAFEGSYFADVPLTLKAHSNDGLRFEKWSDGNSENPRKLKIDGKTELFPLFSTK